jgi:uncharacterized protein YyaL (SSP411 family)
MERECFENPAIAAVMNENVVSVKVDREERPDVDRLYMAAVQAMTGQGGWPLNVFVTPDGKPIIGGTYFPPDPRQGRRAWPDVVAAIGASWRDPEARQRMVAQGEGLTQAVREFLVPEPAESSGQASSPQKCYQALASSFEEHRGGFSFAPKFPMPANLFFLARFGFFNPKRPDGLRAEEMVLKTLRNMAQGGLFDAVGGGFHRYSTDERWFLPHFEKMLYDNAQLAVAFTEAYQRTDDLLFAGVARKTLDYLLRDMAHAGGGFYSAEDADSFPATESAEKVEGAFYVWTLGEIRSAVGDDADLFAHRYGVNGLGNVEADPFGEFSGKNVLYESVSVEETARKFHLDPADCGRRLDRCLAKLREARERQPRPLRDDKILTAWNGLALSAFALGARVFSEPRYLEAAQKTASFVKDNLWDGSTLWRRWRLGQKDVPAMADDHAFLGPGVGGPLRGRFFNSVAGLGRGFGGFGLTTVSERPNRCALFSARRPRPAPSVAGPGGRRQRGTLGRQRAGGNDDSAFAPHSVGGNDRAFPIIQAARLLWENPPRELVVVGSLDQEQTRRMLAVAHRAFLPDLSLFVPEADPAFWARRQPELVKKGPVDGKPTAYLCHNFACQQPATGPEALAGQLGI